MEFLRGYGQKCIHAGGAELPAALADQLLPRFFQGTGRPIVSIVEHRIESIDDREQPGPERYFLTPEPARVAPAVTALVMMPDHVQGRGVVIRQVPQHAEADQGMLLKLPGL